MEIHAKPNAFQKTSTLLGPLIFLLLLAFPLPFSTPEAKRLIAIFAWIVIGWVFETFPLHITGLLGVCLTVFLGVSSAQNALSSFSNPIIFLFLGSFIIAKAFQKYSLDDQFSNRLLSSPFLNTKPWRLIVSLFCLPAFMSGWMSNSAVTALMLPVAVGIATQIFPHHAKGKSYLLIGVAYAASIGGLLTPVGSPPNLIALGLLESLTNIKINFVEWIFYSTPIVLSCLFVLSFIVLKSIGHHHLNSLKIDPGMKVSFSKNQIKILLLIGLLILGWMLPSSLDLIFHNPLTGEISKLLQEGVVALFVALLLFIIPNGQKRSLLLWSEVRDLDWGTLLLFGSGMSLGNSLFQTKLTADLAGMISLSYPTLFVWSGVIICLIYATIFFSELASNTAVANILIPIVISFSAPVDQRLNVLVTCYALSVAFMLPVGTPPNAIVFGSGLVQSKDMLRFGLIMNISCGLIIFGFALVLKFLE